MNDVNNRIFREFTEFFDSVEKSASEISVTMAYEITMDTLSQCDLFSAVAVRHGLHELVPEEPLR